jgi:hypothetical protein
MNQERQNPSHGIVGAIPLNACARSNIAEPAPSYKALVPDILPVGTDLDTWNGC